LSVYFVAATGVTVRDNRIALQWEDLDSNERSLEDLFEADIAVWVCATRIGPFILRSVCTTP